MPGMPALPWGLARFYPTAVLRRRLPPQRPRLSDLRLLPMVQTGHDNGAVRLHAIPDAVFELAKAGPSNVFDDRRVLLGILADASWFRRAAGIGHRRPGSRASCHS